MTAVQPRTARTSGSFPRTRIPDEALIKKVRALGKIFRPTPIVATSIPGLKLFAKLECQNPFGSIKDRAAYGMLSAAVDRGDVRQGTTLIESSSGNFAAALAGLCHMLELNFIPVIDPNINTSRESFLRGICPAVVKVVERDDTGGFLKTRLAKVKELCAKDRETYWPNQYGNLDGVNAHYRLTAGEICDQFSALDVVFIGVSTGGTISGVSRRLKEHFPKIKVVAVDAVGSIIFGGAPGKRHIPGIGASINLTLIDHSLIDDVIHVPEHETVQACYELRDEHGLFLGGSSGSVFAAAKQYAAKLRDSQKEPTALLLCADGGAAYLETVYNPVWASRLGSSKA